MSSREEQQAQRAALVAQLVANTPTAMRELPQWVMWKFVPNPGKPKPKKMPFYASGHPRGWPRGYAKGGKPTEEQPQVEQGHELDRAELLTFEQALEVFGANVSWEGVGFAFLPGDGLVGIDIDRAIDAETGEISKRCGLVMAMAPSYTELSVSGTGVHIVLSGDTECFKSNEIGLEIFCGSQFFICTGKHWQGTPAQVQPIDPEALAILRGMVAQAKAEAKAKRDAEAAVRRAAEGEPDKPAKPRPPRAKQDTGDGGDFRRVNDAAMDNLAAWVPVLFPKARPHQFGKRGSGYRITSKDLGRELEEDIAITPTGIQDWGEEGGRSPIDLVVQWRGVSAYDALLWLAGLLGIRIEKRSASSGSAARRPDPPSEGEDPGPDSTEEAEEAPTPAPAPKPKRAAAKGAGGDGDGKPPKDIDWGKFEDLRKSFALIYGTDTVWDGEFRMIMKIANMGHAHGSDMVRLWKGGKSSPNRADAPGCRWTVHPRNVVFDPTESCDLDTHVNLYGGFPTEARQGDVGPMLELVKFLCSRASDDEDERDKIFHWFLCWWAYPLQHKGAKLRTSVIMHGDEGAGKNFLTDTMVMMYGEYGITVGQDELEDKFNDWRSGKTLVIGDEVSSRAELVHNKNRLKALITSTEVQINPKNLPRRTEKNHINVVFNSNELQPLALDNSDRRYLVLYTPRAREFEFYRELGEWRANGGVAAWYHYLLHYDLDGYDPFAPAPVTKAKSDLIDMNRKSPERFWLEWSRGELGLPYRSCAGAQAYQAYLKYAQRTGDRFPVQRALFTRMVLRISDTMGKPLIDKPMAVDYAVNDRKTDVRTTRMLLALPPPTEGLGEWATDAFHQFERELRRYLGRSTDDGEEGNPV